MNVREDSKSSVEKDGKMNILTQEEREFFLSSHMSSGINHNGCLSKNENLKKAVKRIVSAVKRNGVVDDSYTYCMKKLLSKEINTCSPKFDDEIVMKKIKECVRVIVDDRENMMNLTVKGTVLSLYSELERRETVESLEKEISRMKRTGGCFSLLRVILVVNDRCSEVMRSTDVDIALKEMCRSIRGLLRKYDQVGKFGHNQLLVILPELKADVAEVVVNRVESSVELKNIVTNVMNGNAKIMLSLEEYSSEKGGDMHHDEVLTKVI